MVRRILEAIDRRADILDGEVPSVDDLVEFPGSDSPEDEPFGTSYDRPGEEEEPGEELDEAKRDDELKLMHGGLTQTEKMPCRSYSLTPGEACPRGQTIAMDPTKPCTTVYPKFSGKLRLWRQRKTKASASAEAAVGEAGIGLVRDDKDLRNGARWNCSLRVSWLL